MASNDYHFLTEWQVQGTVKEVFAIISDTARLAEWWPSVYLQVTEVQPGDSLGVGKVVDLYTKGWLPYTLRWRFTITGVEYPSRIQLAATGDFVGRGIWHFHPAGENARITYDWKIRAEKPLLRTLSFLLKPIFAANHRWAMRKGQESLALELARRHAADAAARAQVPPPPGPTPQPSALLLGSALLAVALLTAGALALARRALR